MKTLPMILLLAASSPVAAAPGALEINQDCAAVGCFAGDTPGFPVTIEQPGTYVLTSDLATNGLNGIVIYSAGPSAGPVDIDLQGHTIDGGGTCTGTPVTTCSSPGGNAILAQGTPPVSVHIHDGTLRGYVTALAMFYVEDGSLVDHLTVTQNSNNGIFITSDTGEAALRIRDSQITRNGNSGIYASTAAYVENTSIVGNHATGVTFNVTQSTLIGSRVSNNAGKGVDCSNPQQACALGQNTFAGNNAGGTQFTVTALSDMGGNVCLDHASGACP